MNNIFISYRRADSADVVGRIFEYLESTVGKGSVFNDVHSVQLGIDYLEFTACAVGNCDVQLAVIGHEWLKGRRIDNPEDLVRVEIETALDRDIPVIPVLVGGAEMPAQDELPDSLKPLGYRNAIKVRPDPDFQTDMARLVEALGGLVNIEPEPGKRNLSKIAWGAAIVVAVAALSWFALPLVQEKPSSPANADAAVSDASNRTATEAAAEPDPVRVDRAMEFVDRYNGTGQLLDARNRVSEATANAMDSLSDVLRNSDLTEQELAAAYDETIIDMVDTENLGASLEQLFKFFDQLLICREMGLCDEGIAKGFLDEEGGAFTRTFYPWVCKVRRDWNNPAAFERVLEFYLEGGNATVCG